LKPPLILCEVNEMEEPDWSWDWEDNDNDWSDDDYDFSEGD